MKRRTICAALPVAALGYLLGACSREPSNGPVDIKWDRDVDPRCGMVISDKRFAVQVRDPNRRVTKFDDIGCALFWLMAQTFSEQTPNVEIWVVDYRNGAWIDARQAHYLEGKKSPMGYHYAALATSETGTVPYQEMRKRILARGK